jgi:tetratricopeptide (TPR) repeat protein
MLTCPTHGIARCIRLGLLAATLAATVAVADDYAPVNELLRDGRLPQAQARAEKYLARNPRDARMSFLKGLIQQEAGKTRDAIATYQRLIEDHPGLPEPYNNLAVLYMQQGRSEQARAALEMAKRTSRTQALNYENLGHVYAHLASQSYAHVLQLDSGNTALAPAPVLIRQLITSPPQSPNPAPGAKAGTETPRPSGTK